MIRNDISKGMSNSGPAKSSVYVNIITPGEHNIISVL